MWPRLLGTAGPVLFVLVWLVEGALRPGYDPMRHWVSELALSGRGWIQITAFLLSGALITAFGLTLRRTVPGWGPRLIAVAGVALFLAGVFVIDPGLYNPGGSPAVTTWHGILHDVFGPIMFFSVAAAAIVLSRRFGRGYGLAGGIGTIAFWLAAGALNGMDHAGVWSPAPAGLLQRLAILTGFAYLVYAAWQSARRSRQAPRARSTAA
ncbi:DUF998 domain-containing protein [Planobispora siamensis]|uniref:DUF998 domain-containing protein n=1 Tax=Planobispora siamensis TaxID=936338 RepID=A0A8J3SDC4_9ACTN|nr:DUF998 domain-containing protein [Planobispora siamensis]GIH92317.1 hypothetical protein Psi01_29470 [Planobispora siamensis]